MEKERWIDNLLVAGNMGELKIYRIREEVAISPKDEARTSHKHHKGTLIDRLEPEELFAVDFIDAHRKISEEVTDKEGNYKGPFGSASGEPHNLKLEIEHRLLKEIAESIMKRIREENPKRWHLAFPEEHNRALLERIDPDVREKLGVNIPEDLHGLRPRQLLERFIQEG